jgi:hypothetical protein
MLRLTKVDIFKLKKIKRVTDSFKTLNEAVKLTFILFMISLMMVNLGSRNMQLFLNFKNRVVFIRHIILFL